MQAGIRDQNMDHFPRATESINAVAVTLGAWVVNSNSTVIPFEYVEET